MKWKILWMIVSKKMKRQSRTRKMIKMNKKMKNYFQLFLERVAPIFFAFFRRCQNFKARPLAGWWRWLWCYASSTHFYDGQLHLTRHSSVTGASLQHTYNCITLCFKKANFTIIKRSQESQLKWVSTNFLPLYCFGITHLASNCVSTWIEASVEY